MSVIYRHCLTVLAAALVFIGCSHPPRAAQTIKPVIRPEGARLSTAEAILIAKQTAERQGVDLKGYKEPDAHYEFTRKDKSWFVFFGGRVAKPGHFFSVSVADQTGEAHFHGGK
jgi:hypothetical protein